MNSSSNIPGKPKGSGADSPLGKNWSREEMAAKRTSASEREATDDFDKDAIEGWQKASGGMELMEKIDRKFLPETKSSWSFWIAGVVTITFIAVFLLLPETTVQKPEIAKKQNVTLDKSDVVVSEEIEKFEELPVELQINPKQVVSNFKNKQQQQDKAQTSLSADPEDIDPFILPPKEIQAYPNAPKPTSIDRKRAKEIYLADFKLIDYRAYRNKPEIKSKQMTLTLTGTSANLEKEDIEQNDPAWKSIDIPYHDYISQTMEKFKSGNFKQTLSRTEAILQTYPDDINALFYGGLCYYNLSEMDQAIRAFQQVIANPFSNFDEEAMWYLANAYDLNNDKAKAKELYQLIVNQKGYYAKQAEKLLRK